MKIKIMITLIVGLSMLMMISCESGDDFSPSSDAYNTQVLSQIDETILAFPADSLSEDEVAGLLLMREEEKLARDVYIHLYETWGLRIFNNIAASEATHMYALKVLLDRYELEDPILQDVMGEFANEKLAGLYASMTVSGDSSLTNALLVGATIEDLDIYDLMELTEETDNEDILYAYDNLTRGSRNHIRSFVSQLNRNNLVYNPQFISASLLDSILDTPKEKGSW